MNFTGYDAAASSLFAPWLPGFPIMPLRMTGLIVSS